ncbi:aspartate/glutamate racemase family protein [Halalkalibacter alkaliphilus]|uniref:Aspartate/glutamate racemase family protein n=1 Tax=Halalkalibacter alkaliphilus TaxID=2917993 RepID=A0A9X2CWQ7_9BACI|nr:aspartate/glutamate racemase family protein [Halalkalibacter alkaliphilus]MCL7749689.1 aspartate/glutamate racemase family protein [Halalkalibacter alkaliphilus]
MIIRAKKGQVSYGESIGILMLDTFTPFIPGDVGNATTYPFPVRYQTVKGFTFEKLLQKDRTMLTPILEAGHILVKEGVKAITADCGYMAMFQDEIANELQVPVFLSSLLQIPFISATLAQEEKIGIICSKASNFEIELLQKIGVSPTIPLCIRGMDEKENFRKAAHDEIGILDPDKIEEEVVSVAKEMVQSDPLVKVILLECSSLPPYAAAIQKAVQLPIFDYVTMIKYVHSALVQKRYTGYM